MADVRFGTLIVPRGTVKEEVGCTTLDREGIFVGIGLRPRVPHVLGVVHVRGERGKPTELVNGILHLITGIYRKKLVVGFHQTFIVVSCDLIRLRCIVHVKRLVHGKILYREITLRQKRKPKLETVVCLLIVVVAARCRNAAVFELAAEGGVANRAVFLIHAPIIGAAVRKGRRFTADKIRPGVRRQIDGGRVFPKDREMRRHSVHV